MLHAGGKGHAFEWTGKFPVFLCFVSIADDVNFLGIATAEAEFVGETDVFNF